MCLRGPWWCMSSTTGKTNDESDARFDARFDDAVGDMAIGGTRGRHHRHRPCRVAGWPQRGRAGSSMARDASTIACCAMASRSSTRRAWASSCAMAANCCATSSSMRRRPAASTKPGSSPGANAASSAITTTNCARPWSRPTATIAASTWCSACTTMASASATKFPKQAGAARRSTSRRNSPNSRSRDPATAWWIPAGEWNRYEYLYNKHAAGRGGAGAYADHLAHRRRPAHRRSTKRRWSTMPACGCAASTGQRLRAQLSPGGAQGASVVVDTPVQDAVAHAADRDNAGGLVESGLILNLNEPNKLGDVSAGSSRRSTSASGGRMHLETRPGPPAPSTARPPRTRSAISTSPRPTASAACWSKAGTTAGTATGSPTARTSVSRKAYAGLRHRGACRRTRRTKGVHLIGHHETGAQGRHYEGQLAAAFDLVRSGSASTRSRPAMSADAGQVERQDTAGRPDHTSNGTTAKDEHAITCAW